MPSAERPETRRILVLTQDRDLQRQLSRFFELVGYRAIAACDRASALAAMAAANPQILLLDAELAAAADWELCRQLSQRSHAAPLFKLLLVDDPDESQLQGALEAGIDDFLAKPISHGELLARLRAAARVLEYGRRLAEQGRVDPLTGLVSRSAFTAHLRRQLSEHTGAAPRVACVVLDIDFFARVERAGGTPAADALLHEFARELTRLRAGSEVLGRLAADRFCVLLPGADEAAARKWAETAREALAAAAFKVGDATLKLSASFGAAASETGESAARLLERAEKSLAAAKSLGRNCTVAWSACSADDAETPSSENLFEHTVARDVMTPCTVFLGPGEPIAAAFDLIERTALDGVPVIDHKGKLLGVFERANCAEVAEDDYSTRPVRDIMTTKFKTFEERDPLASLMEYFHGDAQPLAVVLCDGRPAGFVTCNSLVALSRPVETASLTPGDYRDTSDYLLVPDVRPLECEHAG
jgi:diguanylate cyclase (GGDEF)-like protein